MPGSFMPSRQAEQVAWSSNFYNQLVAEDKGEGAFGLTTGQIAAFGDLNTALASAWALVQEPATKTTVTVAAKNTVLKNMKKKAGNLVSIIQGTETVTDANKEALGLTVRDTTPTSRPAPTTAPFVKVLEVTPQRSVKVELQNDAATTGRPANATGATVFVAAGATPPSGDAWTFAGNFTKTRFTVPFGPSETGETVWLSCFWTNAKGQSGPTSTPVSVNLPAGGALPREADEGGEMKIAA